LKRWLQSRGIRYKELDLSDTDVAAELIVNNIFVLSAPILRIDGKFLGPDKVFKDGRLDERMISDLIKRG